MPAVTDTTHDRPLPIRSERLDPLFAPVRGLPGIGARTQTLLGRLIGTDPGKPARHIDLLFHFPTGFTDRRFRPLLSDVEPGRIATLKVMVKKHKTAPGRTRAPYRVTCEDETGEIDLVFFHAERNLIERLLPVGEVRLVSGAVERFGKRLQMVHPDHILSESQAAQLPALEPVYPLTQGLTQRLLRKAVLQALAAIPPLPEWIEPRLLEAEGWPAFGEALRLVHAPRDDAELAASRIARRRLAFDELFANQLAIAVLRRNFRRQGGRSMTGDGRIVSKVLAALPYRLTAAQTIALAEIEADMAAPVRMLRLLQGDVGSGKTVVALLAMARAVEAGCQAALMAPTEVLARQHFETIGIAAKAAGLRLAILTGREQGRTRATILKALQAGLIDIIIGTHALFQPDVTFKRLGLAVIDEQHRFGVHQRFALQAKGGEEGADVLVMTATPIPRTLILTHYGDMDVSRLTEKPAGRKPIITRAVPFSRLDDVVRAIARARAKGAQVYWVCPLVEASQKTDSAAAEERAAHLRGIFGDSVGLVHGRMRGPERDAAIRAFAEGRTGILVATTVIEVGVNVPGATVMVIEDAQQFGLAQLHQLRGRVGRGDAQSTCILLYEGPLSETARARLEILRQTNDGFRIAEEDLRLRGGGEILGARQSGEPGFRIASLPAHEVLLRMAADQTKLLLTKAPGLEGAAGRAAKFCLSIFERDEAVKLLDAG